METQRIAIINGDVLTFDPHRMRAGGLMVENGVITAVGSTADISELIAERRAGGAEVSVIDANEHAVLPGFHDGHTHLEQACASMQYWSTAHTPPALTLEDIRREVRKTVESTDPVNGWYIVRSSFGMNFKVEERRFFTLEELDELSPRFPLVITAGLHVLNLNSAALKAMNLWDAHSSRERVVHRLDDGRHAGVITEGWDLFPDFSQGQVQLGLQQHARDFFTKNGVTSACSLMFSAEDDRAIAAEIDAGRLPARVRSYWHVPRLASLEQLIRRGLRSDRAVEHHGFGGIKVFIDGEHGDGMGNVRSDYKWESQKELDDFVLRANICGIQVLMHAVSHEAVRMGIDAIANASLQLGSVNPFRNRIEHGGDYIAPEDIRLAAENRVPLVTTPHFMSSTVTELEEGMSAPLRAIDERKITLIGGTDTTGTVPEGAAPLYNIACAMARRDVPESHRAGEALSFERAAAMFTVNAARGSFQEGVSGMLRPGMRADVSILNSGIEHLEGDALAAFDLRVDGLLFDGRVQFLGDSYAM